MGVPVPLTVVIVGHGRSPERRGWGSRIDEAGCVVRMWNHDWQDAADYGSRYDWGIIETHNKVLTSFWQLNKREPVEGWIASLLDDPRKCQPLPPRTTVVDQRGWTEAGAVKGRGTRGKWELTRGAFAACWAGARALRGDRIVLVGCDNMLAGKALPLDQAFSPTYINDPATWPCTDYKGDVIRYGHHDFSAERALVEHVAWKHGATVEFAQDIWQ